MSYEEKNAWAFGAIILLTYGGYVTWVLVQAQAVPIVDVAYAWPMIWTIVATIILSIGAAIVIAITRPAEAGMSDERDRQINRRGDQVGLSFVIMGGVAVLVLAMVEAPYFWIANAMYVAFVLSGIVGTVTKIVGYRWGLPA